ncbi:MAG: hypothetical protein U0350_37445 [Caldilineaceae bacterium]
MYQRLGVVKLKSGEAVEAGVVRGPDLDWAQRLVKLLWHKGDPWNWQNAQVLERDLGLDASFYVLHRDGDPFANIMTIELAGVGLFGHVWTQPADRQQGASSSLMRLQMQNFVNRGGQALFLHTDYAGVAFNMYTGFGFAGIEAKSGTMAYYTKSQAEFEAAYFAPGAVEIQPLTWRHWPAATPLFTLGAPGQVRCAPLQLIGREITEGPFLPALLAATARQEMGQPPAVLALVNPVTTAVLGLAAWSWHPVWPDTCLVDCYCHPDYWQYCNKLLNALQLPKADRTVTYIDADNTAKASLFTEAGFKTVSTLPAWVAANSAKTARVDVNVVTR